MWKDYISLHFPLFEINIWSFRSINGLRNILHKVYPTKFFLNETTFTEKLQLYILLISFFVEKKPYMNLSTKARNENDNAMSCFLNSFWHMILFSAPLSVLKGSSSNVPRCTKIHKKFNLGKVWLPSKRLKFWSVRLICVWHDDIARHVLNTHTNVCT